MNRRGRDLGLLVFGLTALAACSSGSAPGADDVAAQADELVATADNCLNGQNMNAADVDIRRCPPLPEYPDDVPLGTEQISLGAWEIGTTATGDTYKYGGIAVPDGGTTPVLTFDGGSVPVNAGNVQCYAKGYYRLRKILQNPPSEWLALYRAHFQYRFFQFQTDLRNGPTGYRKISSYQDHLVKWVTVVNAAGRCQQPTLDQFRAYAKSELVRRGIDPDAGVPDAGSPSDGGADAH